MRFSDMSAQQQDFLARYLGLQPPPDATAPPEDPTGAPARDQFRIFVRDGDGKTVALNGGAMRQASLKDPESRARLAASAARQERSACDGDYSPGEQRCE